MTLPINFSSEMTTARAKGLPIVALESTIITHGMPYPQNLEMARDVEQVIRDNCAVPATIAVLDSAIQIGLDEDRLVQLAQTPNARKLSRADIAHCIDQGDTGATTVAATMICAALAEIHVFATGGIGGVHRGASDSFDISADLYELSKNPVTVVAAGAKAILDIPKTLEVLESLGVPVMTYGADQMPAFWSRDSGLPSPLRVDSPAEIARAARLRSVMGLEGGQLVANPIPVDAEIAAEFLAPIIQGALDAAHTQGIAAKAVTPFLLSHIFEATDGASLVANIALVKNNARLAALIAREF